MYSFEPTEDQQIVITAAKKLAEKFRTGMREADDAREPAADWPAAGMELCLLPASIPEQYGGFGEPSTITWALASEELAFGDLAAALVVAAPNLTALPILYGGTEEQKTELLAAYCDESYVPGSAALMETGIDFNPYALKTVAVLKDGCYVLNGVKCNVPYAAESEWVLVYAALDGATQGFLVKQGTPGFTVKEREENVGLCAFPMYSVELKDCAIPASQRLGGEQGCDFPFLLNASRVALAAMAVGVARASLEYSIDYAKQRKVFGEALAQRQSLAFKFAEFATDIDAARMLVWQAAWELDNGKDATESAYLAKNFAGDVALSAADRAVQVLGGYGYTRDFPAELWLRNARGFAIMEGIAII
ncbi:MAG: acyl-CoA dehydrogenase family protein [Acidobacteriota bacterium]|jgi:alkylation response protein AidB-like acyl-CoA dehydrogenase|nr:acyl-CoA dehydrogenase family protein [Acidobacteriota bacterium]